MSYKLLDKLEDEFPGFAFGKNKENELFVNGTKVAIKFTPTDDKIIVDETLKQSTEESLYDALKDTLLKNKFIKIIKE